MINTAKLNRVLSTTKAQNIIYSAIQKNKPHYSKINNSDIFSDIFIMFHAHISKNDKWLDYTNETDISELDANKIIKWFTKASEYAIKNKLNFNRNLQGKFSNDIILMPEDNLQQTHNKINNMENDPLQKMHEVIDTEKIYDLFDNGEMYFLSDAETPKRIRFDNSHKFDELLLIMLSNNILTRKEVISLNVCFLPVHHDVYQKIMKRKRLKDFKRDTILKHIGVSHKTFRYAIKKFNAEMIKFAKALKNE